MMEHTLKLGESVVIGRGWLKRLRIVFAGESGPDVYSLVAEWTEVHNSAAYNLYFHKSQRELTVLGGRMTVLGVTKHELRFRFER